MTTLRSLLTPFLAALALAAPARAVDAVVNTLADEFDTPSGGSVSLREAIRDVGSTGGTITFAPSLDGGVIELKEPGQVGGGPMIVVATNNPRAVIDALALSKGITIAGSVRAGGVPVAGKSGTPFFFLQGGSLTLRGLTFKDGVSGSTSGNPDLSGAAISIFVGSLTAEFCTFSGNFGQNSGLGGALLFQGGSGDRLDIKSCTFVDNSIGRTREGGGGAIQISGQGMVTVTNSTFTRNNAGVCTEDGKRNHGGAILFTSFAGTGTISHCTISGNKAIDGGGGVGVRGNIQNSTIIIENTIVTGNTSGAPGNADVLMAQSFTGILPPKLTVRGVCNIPNLKTERTDGATDEMGTVLKSKDLKLAALGHYGGRTQTMALRAGSPAIDAAPDPQSGLTVDQCGNPRERGFRCDIGAFEFDVFSVTGLGVTVTTATDELDPPGTEGTGLSLREALRDVPNSGTIRFDSGVFNSGTGSKTITLSAALGPLKPPGNSAIDASGTLLAAEGVNLTIDGGGQTQLFQVDPGVRLVLRRLTLKGGNGVFPGGASGGGAMMNRGDVALIECSLEGNTSLTRGGAIENVGSLQAQRCTFMNNMANTGTPPHDSGGGALLNLGKATLENCTLSGNSATYGGAIDQLNAPGTALPKLVLNHCTVAGNTANELDGGGGIYSLFDWKLTDSIVADNTALAVANDVTNDNDLGQQNKGLTAVGKNIVETLLNVRGGKTSGPALITSDPKLGALSLNGGSTSTIPLLAGSPAIDVASAALRNFEGISTDQRGFAITGKPDLGAFEAGAFAEGQFKVLLDDSTTTMAPSERAAAAAPIVITSGDSELTLTVNDDGTFKGTLIFLGAKYTFSGQFAANRTASIQVTGRNLPTFTLDLTLSGPHDNNLEAKVTGTGFSGEGTGSELTPAKKYLAPPEVVGRYTGGDDGVILAFEITKTGLVRLVGRLHDGTAFALGTRLSGTTRDVDLGFTGRIPLYKKKGFIEIAMFAQSDATFTGDFFGGGKVFRPPGAKPAIPASLAGGFTLDPTYEARRYIPPARGAPLLSGLPGAANMMHADLFGDLANPRIAAYDFTLPPGGVATSALPDFKLKVNAKTGIITGKHPNPTPGGKPLPFVGVLIQEDPGTNGRALSFDANVPYALDFQLGPQ